jgi:iron complex outermembrane receptor protein
LKNLFTAFIALLLPFMASAQFSISGKITDLQTGAHCPAQPLASITPRSKRQFWMGGLYRYRWVKGGAYTIKSNVHRLSNHYKNHHFKVPMHG